MRKMKSRVLAVLMAAGMIFTAQGMTVLAGTTAPSIYAQHGNCRNHAAFHYLKDN